MSSLDDIDKLIRCQDHLLDVIRSLRPVDCRVVEEAGLGFILPTVRAFEHHHRIRYFRTINTVAQFLSKLNFKDTDAKSVCLDEFAQFQEHDINVDITMLDGISKLLPAAEPYRPRRWKFGPGASYEVPRRKGIAPKYAILASEPCNYRTYRLLSSLGYRHWTFPVVERLVSKAIAVPKSIKKRRIITVERTYSTLASQALRDWLLDYIEQTGFNITIEDQSLNRHLALLGSANCQLCTIDLHAASDSVLMRSVRRLFRQTGLLPHLEDARASHVLIEGKQVTMQSYAGMGNAVTFPIESIVFAAVVEYVASRHNPRLRKLYSVYGDDIVVHRSLFKPVCDALRRLGFEVNEDKTYGGDHPFRESCGIEALGGHNVTPLRLSRQLYFDFSNKSVDPLIAVSNNLYDCGYKRAASAVRRWFRLKERGVPYTDDPDAYGMLIWDSPDNRHLKVRYNRDLQCYETRYRCFTQRSTLGPDTERYQAWLMTHWQPEDKISVWNEQNGLPDILIRTKVGPTLAMPRWMKRYSYR